MIDLTGKSVFVQTQEEYSKILRIARLQGFKWSRGNHLNVIDIPLPNMLNFYGERIVTYSSDERKMYEASEIVACEEKIKEAIKNHNTSSLSEKNIEQREATGNQEPIDNKKVSGNTESKGNVDVPKYLEGESEASRKLYSFVSLVAPTPMSVLILGASGTGKEYVARRIHELSQRAGKPFFALDCGAIPKDVAASEFFGHSKGAFTGADQDKKGAFEIANGGTLFLDEMGNLNYEVQVQLLRALQERKIRPLGSNKEIDIDIRLVCATNENLAQRVAEGNFREDLYHRINEFTIYMPELKDRGAASTPCIS